MYLRPTIANRSVDAHRVVIFATLVRLDRHAGVVMLIIYCLIHKQFSKPVIRPGLAAGWRRHTQQTAYQLVMAAQSGSSAAGCAYLLSLPLSMINGLVHVVSPVGLPPNAHRRSVVQLVSSRTHLGCAWPVGPQTKHHRQHYRQQLIGNSKLALAFYRQQRASISIGNSKQAPAL